MVDVRGPKDTITGGPAVLFIEYAEVDVYRHYEEWDINLAISGTVSTYSGADDVDWYLTAEATDREGDTTSLERSGPCFNKYSCEARMTPGNTVMFFHSHGPGDRPVSVTVTMSATAYYAEGPITPPLKSLLHDTYTIRIPLSSEGQP